MVTKPAVIEAHLCTYHHISSYTPADLGIISPYTPRADLLVKLLAMCRKVCQPEDPYIATALTQLGDAKASFNLESSTAHALSL